MKQKIMLFSALLIMFLLAGTASAIDMENTDLVSIDTGLCVDSIAYSDEGSFMMGDTVDITVTFSEPVNYAAFTVCDYYPDPTVILMTPTDDSGTVWCGTYLVPDGVNDAVDVMVYGAILDGNFAPSAFLSGLTPEMIPADFVIDEVEAIDYYAFVIDNEAPKFTIIEPDVAVNNNCVCFNIKAVDKLSETIAYAIFINDVQKKSGVVNCDGYVTYGPELADGYYQWRIELIDEAGNICIPEVDFDLYVDTDCPSAVIISPDNGCVISEYPDPYDELDLRGVIGSPSYDPLYPYPFMTFSFTAEDDFSDDCGLELYYQVYINGEPVEEMSGTMFSDELVTIEIDDPYFFADGAYIWCVEVADRAGNYFTSDPQQFYVNCEGLEVCLNFPNDEFVSSCPEFNFSVSGGAGLPFDYELLIDGEVVEGGTCVVGVDEVNYYSVNSEVDEGIGLLWTVCITDCAGNVYQPEPFSFSVDCTAPAAVANLCVVDALSEITWEYTYDEPGLYVSWDNNIEDDLCYDENDPYSTPYVVLISEFEPTCIEEMQLAEPFTPLTSEYDENGVCILDTDVFIGGYGGESLVYGQDYWVAVIALDWAGNYDECFAVCGPVQTYEDINIMLDEGWNLKSVPKTLAPFNADPESAFGECSTVLYWDGCGWVFPDCIEPCKGYWVYSPEACITNVKFKPMSLDCTVPEVPPCLDLACGWQMIGHTSTAPVHWSKTLGSLQGLLGLEYKFSNLITYSCNEGWGGTISLGVMDMGLLGSGEAAPYPVECLQSQGFMIPGQGYWVFMKEPGTYASIESVNVYVDPADPNDAIDPADPNYAIDPADPNDAVDPADPNAFDPASGNETNGNETNGNETNGNETNGNETNGNETNGTNLNETINDIINGTLINGTLPV
ncbi:hypothetical protein [Methanosarcina sp. WH1]|uniref:hypothetical protein n=1 Tax=Methanosarcina sp. WH1 TaxID=1434102 RepID=UPI000ADFCF9F|nr:hypothetical protein [Methanosarcina sp. WH1]